MEKINFTIANIDSLPSPQTGRSYVHDLGVNGLVLSITPKGTKSYLVYRKLKNKPLRVTLGRFPDMKIEQARREAKKVIARIAEGVNPIEEKRSQLACQISLQEVFDQYLALRAAQLSRNTKSNYKTVMTKYFDDWCDKPLSSITKDKVQARHSKISNASPSAANKAFRVLRALFNYANGQYEAADGSSLFPDNPVNRLNHLRIWNKESPRTSSLSRSETSIWLSCLRKLQGSEENFISTAADYLYFSLLHGLRRREASNLRLSDINLVDRQFVVKETKNGRELTLPITEWAAPLIERRFNRGDSEYLFPGPDLLKPINDPRRVIASLRRESTIHFTIHDLRRTFITVAESLDISIYALKKLVNHSTGWDITADYVVWDIDRLRKPLHKIQASILGEESRFD